MKNKYLTILGIRGLPASHGGFETFAQYLSLYLVDNDWRVVVYCQEVGFGRISKTNWRGVVLIHMPVPLKGTLGTIFFDLWSIIHSLRNEGVFLTLGYNTAVFNFINRLFNKVNIINMDGIEWRRKKWGRLAKLWFWFNERFGCWFGSHLIADHPKIKEHLLTRVSAEKVSMIPYGANQTTDKNLSVLKQFNLEPFSYAIMIARPEPENSILEIVTGFSSRVRNVKLVVLGSYYPGNPYHEAVKQAASNEVVFLGAIYDECVVSALRFSAIFYAHGHQVGGTNPSLVESIGAGNPILAHDNEFNRWVAKAGALYFNSTDEVDSMVQQLLTDKGLQSNLRDNSIINFEANFQWDDILRQYKILLESFSG